MKQFMISLTGYPYATQYYSTVRFNTESSLISMMVYKGDNVRKIYSENVIQRNANRNFTHNTLLRTDVALDIVSM